MSHSHRPGRAGAACVVWYWDKSYLRVLMGAEGKYVSDTIREVNLAKLGDMKGRYLFPTTAVIVTMSEYEKVMVSDLQEAKPIFKMRADYLEHVLNKTLPKGKLLRIQFDTPQPVDATGKKANAANAVGWAVSFRMLNLDLSRIGVIKGGKEPEDSDLRATIVREINEEVGVDVKDSPLTDMGEADGYQCFSLHLHEKRQIDPWVHAMQSRFKERHGEIMDLGFVKVAEKNKDTEVISRLPVTVKSVSGSDYLSPDGIKMNRKSAAALDLFFRRTFPLALALPLPAFSQPQSNPAASAAYAFAAPALPGAYSPQRSVLPSRPSSYSVKRAPEDWWRRKSDKKGGNKMCKTKKRRTIKVRHQRSKKSF